MIAPMDVLDSAVKFGLGALISGLTAYWLAKDNHDRMIELAKENHHKEVELAKETHKKERAQRRGELLEDVSKHFANVDRAGLKYWQYMFAVAYSAPQPPRPRKLDNVLEEVSTDTTTLQATPRAPTELDKELDKVLDEVSTDTTTVQAILWLLGENKCCELFKDYEDTIWEYPDQALNTNKEFQEAREPLRKKRKAFTDELRDIYRKL